MYRESISNDPYNTIQTGKSGQKSGSGQQRMAYTSYGDRGFTQAAVSPYKNRQDDIISAKLEETKEKWLQIGAKKEVSL